MSISEHLYILFLDLFGISGGSPEVESDNDDKEEVRPERDAQRSAPVVLEFKQEELSFNCMEFYCMCYLLAIFSIAVFLERRYTKYRVWECFEIISLFKVGVCFYFYSERVFKIMILGDDYDRIHDSLMKANGAVMLALSVTRCRAMFKTTQTRSALSSYTFSRVIGGMLLLATLLSNQLNANLQDFKHKLSNAHFATAIFGCLLWLLGNTMIVCRIPSFGHYCISVPMRKTMMLDVVFTVHTLFWFYGYPEYVIRNIMPMTSKPDGIHVHLLKTYVCLLAINLFHGIGSIRFHERVDRQGYLFCNMLTYMLIVPILFANFNSFDTTTYGFAIYCVFGALAMINCAFGYINPTKENFCIPDWKSYSLRRTISQQQVK